MINLVSLLVAAALVSLQCFYEVDAQVENSKLNLENNLEANVIPATRRRLRKYVRISTPPPETVRYEAGTRLELDCEVMGSPAPTVHWLKNGKPFHDYEEEANEIPTNQPTAIVRHTSKLILTSARDGDVYTCVAIADGKQNTASTTVYSEGESPDLLTLEKLFSIPSNPIITSYHNEVLQEIGTTLILPCRVYSFVKHQVVWQDNYSNLVRGNSRIQMLPTGDLLIAGLRWSDMGEWTCVAKNMYGKDSISTFLYPTKPRQQ